MPPIEAGRASAPEAMDWPRAASSVVMGIG